MSDLRSGFVLNLLDRSLSAENVLISSGSRKHSGAKHADNCVVPRDDWRPLTEREMSVLFGAAPGPLSESICLFDLGEELVRESHESLLPLLTHPRDSAAPKDTHADTLRRFQLSLSDALRERYGTAPQTTGAADLIVNQPHQESTAFNPELGRFLGLHIDNHQRLPLADRAQAMTLCALNVGFDDRYLNFVNLPVRALLAELDRSGAERPGSAAELKDAFLERFPRYPVLRLVLRPGQGYLCNTQNTMHDGATNRVGRPDISFMTMYRFADTTPAVHERALEAT